ncbi:MAG TPA: YfhO family protein [bacterium]|nr:YfhO family protein [bacterium]HQG45123.1 YfhO family protein [bacterium]HQI49080.1 YfhO family protein [bacterium]HQJ63281.1 YfhO family protein [bacterium]
MKKKKVAQEKSWAPPSAEKETLLTRYPLAALLVLSFLLLLILYNQVMLAGKTFQMPDQQSARATAPFVKEALSRGITPLWCPYIFGGMPSFGSLLSAPHVNRLDDFFIGFFRLLALPDFTFIFFNYLLFALFMFLLMRGLGVEPLPAFFSGLAVIFIPQFVAFTAYGHNTKFLAAVLIPVILLCAKKMMEEKNGLWFSLTALAIGFQMVRAHIQVSYYTFILLGIYFLYKEIADFRRSREIKPLLHSAGLLAGAIAAGVLLSMILYTSVLDYQRYSIRGGSTEGGGLDFDYAANWSFHPLEMVTFFIPSFMGFGGATYWGKMPFTDYPLYFSVVVFLLAGLALALRRDRTTWIMTTVALFSLLVSFGKHFGVLYAPLFKILPYFNKFRVPSMIHIILDISMLVLAGIGLQALFELRTQLPQLKPLERTRRIKSLKRFLYTFAGVVAVLGLMVLLGRALYMEMAGSGGHTLNDAQRVAAYNQAVLDSLKSIGLVAIAVVLILQFLKNSLSRMALTLLLSAMVVFDLWAVDAKIIQPQDKSDEKAFFAATPAVQFLQKDKELYRIFPVLDDKSGNWYMYHFIHNISGYSAAKLRLYQDFLDETGFGSQDRYGLNSFLSKYWRVGMQGNRYAWIDVPLQQIAPERLAFDSAMLDMLNVKYLVQMELPCNDPRYQPVGDPKTIPLYRNTTVLPRAFFADSVLVLKGRKSIFDYMKSGRFNPRRVAVIEENPPFTVSAATGNTADIVKYDLHQIVISAKIKSPTILVLSEIYYPAGWKAFVDGKESKIFKTNYLLRGLFLPAGDHQILFKFNPASYQAGEWITGIVLLLLIGLLGHSLWMVYRNRRKSPATA